MPIIPYDAREGRPAREMAVTVDKMGRLYLNKALQIELGCVDKSIKLYIGYDPVNKRIGLAKPDVVRLTDHRPLSFGAGRAYASALGFLQKYKIPYKDGARRYVYDGKEDGWWTFKLEEYDAPDDPKNYK